MDSVLVSAFYKKSIKLKELKCPSYNFLHLCIKKIKLKKNKKYNNINENII